MRYIIKGKFHSYDRQGINVECVKYLDGALYNLKHKITEIIIKDAEENTMRKFTMNNSLMKLRLQAKFRLQMCAMLSQVKE